MQNARNGDMEADVLPLNYSRPLESHASAINEWHLAYSHNLIWKQKPTSVPCLLFRLGNDEVRKEL